MKLVKLHKVNAIARDFIQSYEGNEISVADVGCYKRPIYDYVTKLKARVEFLGVDEDPVAIDYLKGRGLKGTDAAGFTAGPPYDFTFGLEVIEHIAYGDSREFLSLLRDKTKAAFFLTTPNFEGFNNSDYSTVSVQPDYREMRYIPDHLRYFSPSSSNPHHHKQIMTVQNLEDQLSEVLSPNKWDFVVMRAWPWILNDLSNERKFVHFFKLHVVAWKKRSFAKNMTEHVDLFCKEWRPVFAEGEMLYA